MRPPSHEKSASSSALLQTQVSEDRRQVGNDPRFANFTQAPIQQNTPIENNRAIHSIPESESQEDLTSKLDTMNIKPMSQQAVNRGKIYTAHSGSAPYPAMQPPPNTMHNVQPVQQGSMLTSQRAPEQQGMQNKPNTGLPQPLVSSQSLRPAPQGIQPSAISQTPLGGVQRIQPVMLSNPQSGPKESLLSGSQQAQPETLSNPQGSPRRQQLQPGTISNAQGLPYPGLQQIQPGTLSNQQSMMSLGAQQQGNQPGMFSSRPIVASGAQQQGSQPGMFQNRPIMPQGVQQQGHQPGMFQNRPMITPGMQQQPGMFQNRPMLTPGIEQQVNQPGMLQNRPIMPPGAQQQGNQPGMFQNRPMIPSGMQQPIFQRNQPGVPLNQPAGVPSIPQQYSQPQPGAPMINSPMPSYMSPISGQPGMGGLPGYGSTPQRPRIDPDSLPSPVAVHEADQLIYNSNSYFTMSKTNPPLVATKFKAIDEGL